MDRSPCSATAEYSVAQTTRLDTSSASSDEPSRQDSAVVVGIGPTSLPAVTPEHGGDDSSYTLAAVADRQAARWRAPRTAQSSRRSTEMKGGSPHAPVSTDGSDPPGGAAGGCHRRARGGSRRGGGAQLIPRSTAPGSMT